MFQFENGESIHLGSKEKKKILFLAKKILFKNKKNLLGEREGE